MLGLSDRQAALSGTAEAAVLHTSRCRVTKYKRTAARARNTVERLINRLKDWRGIATRFDKTPESSLAGLELRASMIWVGDFLQTAD